MNWEFLNISQSYGIDIGASILLYNKSKSNYKCSECYNNAFKCMTDNFATVSRNKAVIGYVISTDGIKRVAVRHAWNIIDGNRIDVTMFANDENPLSVLNYGYLPVAEYNADEFLEAVEENNGYPALPKTPKEYRIRHKLKKMGFEILE